MKNITTPSAKAIKDRDITSKEKSQQSLKNNATNTQAMPVKPVMSLLPRKVSPAKGLNPTFDPKNNNQQLSASVHDPKIPIQNERNSHLDNKNPRIVQSQEKPHPKKIQVIKEVENPKEECKLTNEEIQIYGNRFPSGYKQSCLLGK